MQELYYNQKRSKPLSIRSHSTGERAINNGSSIDFVFAVHSIPNMPRIFEAVRDTNPDIVAIEMPGLEAAKRAETQQKINQTIVESKDVRVRATRPYHQLGRLPQIICEELEMQDVSVSLIDVDADHPSLVHHKIATRALEVFHQSKQQADYTEYIYQYAQANRMREEVMTTQLEGLVGNNPGAKIAVVTGALHTPLYHNLAKVVPTSRRFVDEENAPELHASEVKHYAAPEELIRRSRLGLEMSKEAITNAIISAYNHPAMDSKE